MKLSETQLMKIGRDHLGQLDGVNDLFVKYSNRLSFGGQGEGEGRYRVGIYLGDPPLPLEQLRKISVAGRGTNFC